MDSIGLGVFLANIVYIFVFIVFLFVEIILIKRRFYSFSFFWVFIFLDIFFYLYLMGRHTPITYYLVYRILPLVNLGLFLLILVQFFWKKYNLKNK